MTKTKKLKKKPLTIQQRKVAVLKDALKQLAAKNIVANAGDVVRGNFGEEYDDMSYDSDMQPIIQKLFKKGKLKCEVCLRGALLLSTVNKENNFTKQEFCNISGGSFYEDTTEDTRLLELFSDNEIKMMENAFETTSYRGINSEVLNDEDCARSLKFGEKYKKDFNRMKAILENAIKNKGTFTP